MSASEHHVPLSTGTLAYETAATLHRLSICAAHVHTGKLFFCSALLGKEVSSPAHSGDLGGDMTAQRAPWASHKKVGRPGSRTKL